MTDCAHSSPTADLFTGATTELDLSRRGITGLVMLYISNEPTTPIDTYEILSELPPQLATSSGRLGLKVLSLAGNSIATLPTWFSTHFPYLRRLDLSHNPLGDEAISKLGRNFGRYRHCVNSFANLCIFKTFFHEL